MIIQNILRIKKRIFFKSPIFFIGFRQFFGLTPVEEILNKSMKYIDRTKLTGDYLEFGVFNGNSFITAYHLAKLYNLNIKFFAFDSFTGLPKTSGIDKASVFSKGEYSCSLEQFKKNISNNGVDLDRMITVKGYYEKVLNEKTKKKLGIKVASIIFIDSDLYNSALCVLDFIKDYLQDGTILIFDNWFYGLEKKAFEDWLKKNKEIKITEFHKYDWKGNSFIVNRECK